MAISNNSGQSLLPSFLYSTPSSTKRLFGLDTSFSKAINHHHVLPRSPSVSSSSSNEFGDAGVTASRTVIPSPKEGIEMYSPAFYAACKVGGMLSCGLTHTALTPLDIVKCNMQIDPVKYKSIVSGFGVLIKEQGAKASAELIADVALCPMEAVKVRVQTQPGFARGLSDGFPKLVKAEGVSGLYKGITPLWGRQIPYTMMKFATFENIVELIYKYSIPTPKDQCSNSLQLGVSFAGGYIAGVFCAVVSHPADNLVSFLNNAKGATVGDAVKKLGLWGLFTRSLPLRIVMIGTLTGAQWVIYDAMKVFVGLPTTGGGTPAPAAAKA
ncbi:hypothetical protein CRYUN_Cryun19dG0010700 [Craigia yunnanensis]